MVKSLEVMRLKDDFDIIAKRNNVNSTVQSTKVAAFKSDDEMPALASDSDSDCSVSDRGVCYFGTRCSVVHEFDK